MKMTKHAKIRCQQRGIKSDLLDIILLHGKESILPGGATGYFLRKKDRKRLVRECKRLIQLLDHFTGIQIIESAEGLMLTAYHRR